MRKSADYETGHLWLALKLLQDEETLAEFPAHMKMVPPTPLDDLMADSRNNLKLLNMAKALKNKPKEFANRLGINPDSVNPDKQD